MKRASQTRLHAVSPFHMALDETLLWLCGIDSPIGEEEELCAAVSERMAKLNLPAPIRRYGNSIVVPIRRTGSNVPHIALVGHLDTVRTENGPARLLDGKCYGAGASDMKSGLAVMIVLAETFASSAKCDLTLVFYAREEGPFLENELGPVLEQDPELKKVDLAVCMEPSDNRLHLGCSGSIHATVTFEGRTAHSARPWEGESAITKAASLIAKIGALQPIESVIDGHTFRTVTTITQAKDGGRGRNVVPDRFTLNVNHRFAPSTSLEEAKKNVASLLEGHGRFEFTDLSPGAMPNATHPLVQKLIASGVRSVEPKQAWTDVARFSALGIPAVNFGPGENAQAHQKNEFCTCALLYEGYGIMKKWLSELN